MSSVIDARNLLGNQSGDLGGGIGTINNSTIDIAAGDTPHDFKPGRTAGDDGDDDGEGIDVSQEEAVLIAAGQALYHAKQLNNAQSATPPELPAYDNSEPGMQYLSDALNILTNDQIGSVNNYERRMETFILNQDVVKTNFGSTTTVYIQDVLHAWEQWSEQAQGPSKPERPQFWCDICGKSTDSVSKALIDKTIDLKWNPNDTRYDHNKIYKKVPNGKFDSKHLRILANFIVTYMHPEENAGSIKAAFVFDMHSGSIGKAVAVLNQMNNALIPQVVSDSASTNMEQIPSGKNILWFPTTDAAQNEYEYQANIYTFPLGIRLVIRVAEGDVSTHYNNKNDAFMNNFKIVLRYGGIPSPPNGSLMAIAQQIFAGNEYELNFRLDASNVGASVAYLASIIYAMKNNQTLGGLQEIPDAINKCTPSHSNMINISNIFATLATNINTSALAFQQKSKAYNILCFLLFDIKRSGDWEQARACFYLPEDIIGKPLFCTGDILCSVFARMIGANSIWRAPKAGSIKDWYFRIHRKVNKALDQDVKNAIVKVQQCNDIVKVLESVNGIQPLMTLLETLNQNALQASQVGIFKMPGKNDAILIRVQKIITYIARCRALDISQYIQSLLSELEIVKALFKQCFPGLDSGGIYNTFTLPLKTLINMFYAIGNPQPQNALSFNKKAAIQAFSTLFEPDPSQGRRAFSVPDANVDMMVEDPVKIIDDQNFINVSNINIKTCMQQIDALFAYEDQAAVALQSADFGSLNKALTRLQVIASSGKDFSTLYDKIAASGINRQNIEVVNETVNPKRVTSQVIFDIGTKSPADLIMTQDGLFNKAFRSSTFNYTASSLQKMGHQLKQHFTALTTSGGIRFQTSADNFIGNPMDSLDLFELIMKQRLDKNAIIKRLNQRIKGQDITGMPGETQYASVEQIQEEIRGIKVVQIAPPPLVLESDENNNKNSIQKVFCRSLPGFSGSWCGLTAEKGKGSYMTFASESLDFKNSISSELMTKGMGFLSGFTMRNLKKEVVPYKSGYEDVAIKEDLYDGEKQLYKALANSNKKSFAGFKLFNMASPLWDKLEGGRANIELCRIALNSKAAMATWFYEMFQLPNGRDEDRGALTQYIVNPNVFANPEVKAAISRLHGAPASANTKTSQWQKYGRDMVFPGWTSSTNYPTAMPSGDLTGYNQLISDTVLLINSFSRNLPMIYLTLSLYAYNMNIIFPKANRNQFYTYPAAGQEIKIGFIISGAVESACLYSGVNNDNEDINDTILASLQSVYTYATVKIPEDVQFTQGGGSAIQKGGSNPVDERAAQNKMIQDLYYNVTGIASSGIITLLSTRLQLDVDGALARLVGNDVIPVFDIDEAGAQQSVLKIINDQLGLDNYMLAFEILLIILTLEAKGLTMKLLSNAMATGDANRAIDFLQKQGINDNLVVEARLLFQDSKLNVIIQLMATIQEDKLSEIAFSMKAYSDQVKSVWGQEMVIITSNESFTYTPTFTDFILSTSFAISGNISGECDIDIPFLYGIYYDGPLANIADSSAFTTTSLDNSFPDAPQSASIATGLPSFMSLVSYANRSSQITMEQVHSLYQTLPELYSFTVVDGNIGRAPLYNGDEALKPSFMLYQLIKACYPAGFPSAQSSEAAKSNLRTLENNVRLYMTDQSQYPTILMPLVKSSHSPTCFFISPAFKTLQTLSLIGSLLNITRNAALENANENINVILQSNQINGNRSLMMKKIREIYQSVPQLQQEQQIQTMGQIRNLIDMLNQMNGYNLVNPATNEYYPPGGVDPEELKRQMAKLSNPIPPFLYPADLTNIQQVLITMEDHCQSNKDGNGFNTAYVQTQINEQYTADGALPKKFYDDYLARFAFSKMADPKIAFYNYFYKPWVTVNGVNAQDPILTLYRFIMSYAVRGEQLTVAFPNSIPYELRALFNLAGGKKSKTRKNRKKKRHTRRNRNDNKKNRTKYKRSMHQKHTKKHQ